MGPKTASSQGLGFFWVAFGVPLCILLGSIFSGPILDATRGPFWPKSAQLCPSKQRCIRKQRCQLFISFCEKRSSRKGPQWGAQLLARTQKGPKRDPKWDQEGASWDQVRSNWDPNRDPKWEPKGPQARDLGPFRSHSGSLLGNHFRSSFGAYFGFH